MGWIKASDDQHYEQERAELIDRLMGHSSQSMGLSDEDVRRIAIALRKELKNPTREPEPGPDPDYMDPEEKALFFKQLDINAGLADWKKTQG